MFFILSCRREKVRNIHTRCDSPPPEEGWTRPQTILPKASFDRSGRGGENISDHPVCAVLTIDAQPPLLWRRGIAAPKSFRSTFRIARCPLAGTRPAIQR